MRLVSSHTSASIFFKFSTSSELMCSKVVSPTDSTVCHTFWCTCWRIPVTFSTFSSNSVTILVLFCCCVRSVVTCYCSLFVLANLAIFFTNGSFFVSFFTWFTSVSVVRNCSVTFSNSSSSIKASHIWEICSTVLAQSAFTSSILFATSVAAFLLSSGAYGGVLGVTCNSKSVTFL